MSSQKKNRKIYYHLIILMQWMVELIRHCEWWIDSPLWTFCLIIPRLLKQTFINNSWRRSCVPRTLSSNFHIKFWSYSLTYTKKTKIIQVNPLNHSHSDFSMKFNSNDDNYSLTDAIEITVFMMEPWTTLIFFFHFPICIVFPVLNAFDLIFLALFIP